MRIDRTTTIAALGATVVLLLAACGSSGSDDSGSNPFAAGGSSDDTATGNAGPADIVVRVDGTEYPVTTVQTCDTVGEPARNTDLTVFGYAESGERVELTFMHQPAEFSPSGQDEYYGAFSLSSGGAGDWQVDSMVPWPFLAGDRSQVSGLVTMEDAGGQTAEISFDISCG